MVLVNTLWKFGNLKHKTMSKQINMERLNESKENLNTSDVSDSNQFNIGDKVIVLQNLVEEVKFNGEVLNVCPESGIVATIL